jgi:hypothetical protein
MYKLAIELLATLRSVNYVSKVMLLYTDKYLVHAIKKMHRHTIVHYVSRGSGRGEGEGKGEGEGHICINKT